MEVKVGAEPGKGGTDETRADEVAPATEGTLGDHEKLASAGVADPLLGGHDPIPNDMDDCFYD
jgi:hypothetical protein